MSALNIYNYQNLMKKMSVIIFGSIKKMQQNEDKIFYQIINQFFKLCIKLRIKILPKKVRTCLKKLLYKFFFSLLKVL